MMRGFRSCCALAALTAVAAYGAPSAAADAEPRAHVPLPGSDGVYGRFDGNLALAASGGAELEAGEPRAALRLSLHYLWTAGVYARYSDAFGSDGQRPQRAASFGIDLRPLFLPRFALDNERGPALYDLALDSLSLTAGAYFAEPRDRGFGDERGFETGVGLGVPLFGAARGLWLEGRAERRFADRGPDAWLFTLGIGFHAITWSTDADRR